MPSAVEEFHRVAALDEGDRPWLNARTFEGFDPYPPGQPASPDLIHSIRNLPHIRMRGATYFVTFRIKKGLVLEPADREDILEAMLHWHGVKCVIYAAVVLEDHVHMILRPTGEHNLSDILHSVKRYSARRINQRKDREGVFWQDEFFDHIVRDSGWLTRFIYYICDNPVKREFVGKFDEYEWLYVNAEEVSTEQERPFGHRLQTSLGHRQQTVVGSHRGDQRHRLQTCATKQQTFAGVEEDEVIRVYTTRPDTLFGATYMVLAPEHALVEQITTDEQRQAVREYVAKAVNKSELDRMADTKEKTGVFTGAYAINPVNREKIPVWVADYVMMGYGTGAIMAVPAHDERDYEFATQFGLPILPILKRRDEADARYCVEMAAEQFALLWAHFTAHPDSCPALRGIGAGNIDSFTPSGKTYNPTIDDPNVNPILVMSIQRKRMIFVGADGLGPLAGIAGDMEMRPAPVCISSLDDTLEYIHSGQLDGLSPEEGKAKITADLEADGLGMGAIQYKLRDWLFSRQRYWGEPFPIVHCEKCGTVALPESSLPLELPPMEDFSPASSDDPAAPPAPPLGKVTDWSQTACPTCQGPATRELNTMPQWAGSCWYYLRYLDPKNSERFCDPDIAEYWMGQGDSGGVDLYVGGAEHAVLHLLYARFWHKVLYDLGHAATPEPFYKLFNQGMIRSFAYRDSRNVCIGYDDVDFREDGGYHKQTGEKLSASVEKMSKSLKNVVNPDEVIAQYGADTFRLYEMFMGPLDASKPWNTRDVPGLFRFLQRIWRMIVGGEEDNQAAILSEASDENIEIEKALHKLIKKVGEDVEAMKFNTAIAAMMEFVNACFKAGAITNDQAERFVLVLAPFAPHIAEDLWQALGHDQSLAHESFPVYDEEMLVEETIELPVQVNGKMRGKITVAADADQDTIVETALQDDRIADYVQGKAIVKKIVVPGRLVNLVVK
ncbi:MAG: class I tRNA ligase family protein [Phycisphaerae bacterium]|nr:class I tRNA ligase family protein [Phycisphaerae bacterium]